MFRKIALFVLLAGAVTLSACNTIKGVGRDVKSVGKKVEDGV
jgi:predicted small secreted protein